jgi:hypothetical protein
MLLRSVTSLACTILLTSASFAQMAGMGDMKPNANQPMDSPSAKTAVQLNGKSITIDYNSPRMRGRKIMGGLVPYGEEWRTGANPATTLKTPMNLKIGTLDVPAGTYTIFTLPNANQWLFIVSKKTGEWGIPYPKGMDLGRTPMTGSTLSAPQENMSLSFEHTSGASTELHVKWENTDQFVKITAQ